MRQKRGQASVWDVLIWSIVLLVAALIVIFGFRAIFKKETSIVGEQISKCQNPSVPGRDCKETCSGEEKVLFGVYEDCKAPKIVCCAPKEKSG